ncbi:MAG: UDP-N-acetylglucosamine 2-epimerase [Candidatus Peribacteraceae bacterium]|jgi:UDP-hydrolysing UDP-N-acetyl-D-glucosamine 2-epimerase|nr:UDP-N-acetylglucosamine 2-epimerase [Candidatus Peribacteraceae bacterium]|tara:strand:+ start:1391 stop:2524 length:1134 start_codon:yes stop_codon:yes gene_type:complete
MKLLFVTGTRAEWGFQRPIVDLCRKENIEYEICATNMMMLPAYGNLIEELKSDGYNVQGEIFMSLEGHTHATMAKSMAVFMSSFVDTLVRVKPTWAIIPGDRGEALTAAIAAAYCYIPIAHIQAGELSGNIDGVARHAIGKCAHIHFCSNADAAERLKKLGEEQFRIHQVGHPGLDDIVSGDITPIGEFEKKYDLSTKEPYVVVVFHPVTEDYDNLESQTETLIESVENIPMKKVWILPNNDAGAGKLRSIISHHRKADTLMFSNVTRPDYFRFLTHAKCLIGNSSSGLTEAPSFALPTVNVGRRQQDRVRGENVIDASLNTREVTKAIEQGVSDAFHKKIANMQNPYGDGHSAERILQVLKDTPIDDKLLVKRLTY